jgi:hypothetical protein
MKSSKKTRQPRRPTPIAVRLSHKVWRSLRSCSLEVVDGCAFSRKRRFCISWTAAFQLQRVQAQRNGQRLLRDRTAARSAFRQDHKAPQSRPARPAVGDQVTFVDYGLSQLGTFDSNPDKKRYVGQNPIAGIDLSTSNIILIINDILGAKNGKEVQSSSDKAIANSGDAGGSLFDDRRAVIGVASTSTAPDNDNGPTKASAYVNLNHPSVATTVRQQLASAPDETSYPKSNSFETSSPRSTPNAASQQRKRLQMPRVMAVSGTTPTMTRLIPTVPQASAIRTETAGVQGGPRSVT